MVSDEKSEGLKKGLVYVFIANALTLVLSLLTGFVLPKMLEINSLVGCEYAYLFAADSSRDNTLIKYYEDVLHFERPTALGGIKPQYDFLCTFMCKRLRRLSTNRKMYLDPALWENEDPKSLEDYRKEFFENFNK